MSKVMNFSDVHVRVVGGDREIEQLRWFQTRRYFETGLLGEMPSELPSDPSVEHSTYFGAYDNLGRIHACTRLIHPLVGLPLLAHHEVFPGFANRVIESSGGIAEVSRLAVAKNAPHYRALGLMARELFRYTLRHQHSTALLASIEVPFIRILDQVLGIPVEVIGPEINQYQDFAGACVPVLIDTVRYLTEPQWRQHRRWSFFTEGLIIDLTGNAAVPSYCDESLIRAS